MHKVLVSLVAILAAAVPVAPALAQQVASVEVSRIVIAPPQTELARTIKAGLSAAYYGARPDTAAHAEAQRRVVGVDPDELAGDRQVHGCDQVFAGAVLEDAVPQGEPFGALGDDREDGPRHLGDRGFGPVDARS